MVGTTLGMTNCDTIANGSREFWYIEDDKIAPIDIDKNDDDKELMMDAMFSRGIVDKSDLMDVDNCHIGLVEAIS